MSSVQTEPNAVLKRRVADAVADAQPELVALSRAIHAEPELCFEEHRASARVAEALEGAGFAVRRGIAGLDTALEGRSGEGALNIGLCAEYDALPDVGHACGHNVIAAAAVGAGIGLAAVADDLDLTVRVLGTPAEEGGGGKILMLERGAFDGLHAAMMVHPTPIDAVTFRCLALAHIDVRFESDGGGHASFRSGESSGSAADALDAAWSDLRALRSQLGPDEHVNGVILDAGRLPNVVPTRTELKYFLRAPDLRALAVLEDVVTARLEATASTAGARLTIIARSPRYSEFRHDPLLARLYEQNATALGRVFAGEEARDRITPSTDMANVSLEIPTIHPLIGIDSLPAVNHAPAFADCCVAPAADQAIVDGAVALAWTAIDAATDATARERLLSLGRGEPATAAGGAE